MNTNNQHGQYKNKKGLFNPIHYAQKTIIFHFWVLYLVDMPPFKSFILLCLLLHSCFLFHAEQLYAQQPTNRKFQSTTVNPLNASVLDSLQRLRDIQKNINPNLKSNQEVISNIFKGPTLLSTNQSRLQNIHRSPGKTEINQPKLLSEICYTISGRDFLKQDSLIFFTGDPILTADGNVILSGEAADYAKRPLTSAGFCMKTDLEGNVIWAKLYDSIIHLEYDFLNLFRSIELRNGNILLAGRTANAISGNDDFVLMKLDHNGNMIWFKTYESRFWQGFNGSGDYFVLRDLEEDPATGELYFAGYHWGSMNTLTKIDPANGEIIWSNAYSSYNSDRAFGIVINTGNLLLFQLENGYYNNSNISVTSINKTSGDTLFKKSITQTGDLYSPRLYNTFEVVKQNNGHYLLSGPTTGYFEYPIHTGTVDLFHAGIIELDENFDFVKAYGFKNRIESNSYNTKISLFPDGSGVFTMLKFIDSYSGDAHVSVFKNGQIYHQRKRLHYNEGLPYEPRSLQLPDGGSLNIKMMGDSTKLGIDGSRIDYYRMHSSDTASICMGIKDTATSLWYFDFERVTSEIQSIQKDVFKISRPKKIETFNFQPYTEPACQLISHCDLLKIKASETIVCPGTTVIITIQKNKECGSLVPLVYDTNWVKQVIQLTDTTYAFYFDKPGKGFIQGSLMGCIMREDSVYIEVISTRYALELGPDTTICPGNKIQLNAGAGFKSYKWQDGSTDSIFMVTKPGLYYLSTLNKCGTTYNDTIQVMDYQFVPISIGQDRVKCNNDTLMLNAPVGFINYTWSSDMDADKIMNREIIVNPQVSATYFITAEKMPGCFTYDTLQVIVKKSPAIYLGADTSICQNETLVLDAGSAFQVYEWSTGDQQQKININKPGNYAIKATTTDGCISTDTLQLMNLYNLPKPDLGADSIICIGQPRTLSTNGSYAGYNWSTSASSKSIIVHTPGTYWLTVTDANGCRASDTTFIPLAVAPPAKFLGPDTTICSYGNLLIQTDKIFKHYLWNTGSAQTSINIQQPGNYWLQVTDENNCTGTDSITIALKDCMLGLYVPTAFTPNNDGLNDVFTPYLFGEIKYFHFQVFNRWGQTVFRSTTPGTGWDGNYKGLQQESSVFVWVCSYQLAGGETEQKRGTVTIVR